MLTWTIYEIFSEAPIQGRMVRGRIRKFAVEHEINLLTENASDKENTVRFALNDNKNLKPVEDYIYSIIPDAGISKALDKVQNPVLSRLVVNNVERYKNA